MLKLPHNCTHLTCFIDYAEAFDCVDHCCGKFLKRREYQTSLPASWETYMQVKKQQLEPDMDQGTDSKLGKKYVKAVYCHPDYVATMQICFCCLLTQSCLILCDPMDCM